MLIPTMMNTGLVLVLIGSGFAVVLLVLNHDYVFRDTDHQSTLTRASEWKVHDVVPALTLTAPLPQPLQEGIDGWVPGTKTPPIKPVSSASGSSLIGHLVPHSHCDAAYKKTLDEYYETEVRHVLNSVVSALKVQRSKNASKMMHRRFVWSETIFLTKWWKDPRTSKTSKQSFRDLVQRGIIEIVNGGWVMHDEAITRYDSQIHQMTLGHDNLAKMLNIGRHRPLPDNVVDNMTISTGWQIDPFGPTMSTVTLYAWSGMDIIITNRIPAYLKDELKKNKSLEFYWNVTPTTSMLVHILDTHYESPVNFDWESLDHPTDPITIDTVQERSDQFMAILRARGAYYRTPNILIPMGGDFRFQNASLQFENMERIMEHVQSHPERYQGDRLIYSTVRDYTTALLLTSRRTTSSNSSTNRTTQLFPMVTGSPFLSWAGFYTQLPALKQAIRTCEIILRTCEVQLFQTFRLNGKQVNEGNKDGVIVVTPWDVLSDYMTRIRVARETVGLMQHHDALPATSYRFVLSDYMKRLSTIYNDMTDVLLNLIQRQQRLQSGVFQQDLSMETSPFTRSLTAASDWVSGSMIGGGPYIYETLLVRGTQNARSINLDKVLNPQMGMMGGIHLVVVNSLGRDIDTMVHFVCTRPDVALLQDIDGQTTRSKPILSQVTPLEHEIESSNLGLFTVSFRAHVPALGTANFRLHVCDLTWSTDQHPPPHVSPLECAHQALSLSEEDLIRDGLSSSSIHVQFDKRTNDIASMMTKTWIVGNGEPRVTTIELNHDIILYNGQNDTIYNFYTSVDSSDPSPLLGTEKRRVLSAYRGYLFSEVTLELTSWLAVRYRVVNATDTSFPGRPNENNKGSRCGGEKLSWDSSLLQISMLSGPIPPNSNVASRLKTNFTQARWFNDENSFHPVLVGYNESIGVGDGNLRPLVSRSWLEEESESCRNGSAFSEICCPTRLTIYSTDPRGVVSRDGQRMDVFWHRRNNMTHAWWQKSDRDWWKEGEDMSTVRTSVWLSLDGCDYECYESTKRTTTLALRHRVVSSSLAHDALLLQLDGQPTALPMDPTRNRNGSPKNIGTSLTRGVLPSQLHLVSLKLSGTDPGLDNEKSVFGDAVVKEAWVDLQIENLSEDAEEVDVAAFLGDIPRLVLDAASLRSLTFLHSHDATRSFSGNGVAAAVFESRVTSDCSLTAVDGGKRWLLRTGARTICSVRVPVAPLRGEHMTHDAGENSFN